MLSFLCAKEGFVRYTYAEQLTNESIQKKEKEIKQLQSEQQQLKNGLNDVKKMKAALEASKNDLDRYVTELDNNLASIQERIAELGDLITEKEGQIEERTEELNEAIAVQTAQYEAMKKRIKFMYERGDTMYVELLLHTGNLGETLNKGEYIEKLSAYDKRKLDEYVAYSEYVKLCKEILEEEKQTLDEAKAAQEAEEENVNELIEAKEAEITRVSADIALQSEAIKEYEADIAAQNETIRQLEAAVAAERKALEEENRRKYDGGVFKWPAPSYTRISDDYGTRIHPILGIEKFHNGIDMAAPGGSPILAAYDGKVVAAAYSASMGNYIMIDHGDSVYTIYMHASALYVSQGQEVSRGQKIAAVGTTGRSTGNHLHFSVRKNGEYVNPWSYLGR
ncbi:MAG: peptidoglycan DD-metalloendopeptidase family protein [Lachnospiraceae bacterium]|nr:peptidoglycan DD-metalloendopeptidase family protein [Lachnospiraceae bacterium]